MKEHNLKSTSQVLYDLKQQGYTANFRFEDNQLIPFDDSSTHYNSNDFTLVDTYRFEGNTDPADDSILYIIETKDGKKGTISNGYRAFADTELDEYMGHAVEKTDGTISQ